MRVLSGAADIAKLLSLVDDDDFNRPSFNLMPLWGMSAHSISILTVIARMIF
jgi:hypothetical protein